MCLDLVICLPIRRVARSWVAYSCGFCLSKGGPFFVFILGWIFLCSELPACNPWVPCRFFHSTGQVAGYPLP